MINRVLFIDSDTSCAPALIAEIRKELKIEALTATSFEQTKQLLSDERTIHAAIVDPTLSDDLNGDVIDLLIKYDIPVIVFTANIQSDLLNIIINKAITDYVIKSYRSNVTTLIKLLSQVLRHQQTAILLIDDSKSTRMLIKLMLDNLNLHIIEANGVNEALKKIKEHPEIKLLLTDFSMEGQTGIDLTYEVRKQYSNKELPIIGLSSSGNAMLSADFIKSGANDFISKPLYKQELINRVLLQLDMVNYIETIKAASERDFLTGIYNRRYLYEVGRKLFDNAKRGNISLACAMIDIDHFKHINDSYGHDMGDKVIIRLAQELSNSFRKSDIVGRLGGEEFGVLLSNPDMDNLEAIFDKIRQKIENIIFHGAYEDKKTFQFSCTVSIGVTFILNDSFEEMIKFADLKLYEAKNYGRNRVVL